jgi:hypothetical protein
MDQKDIIRKLLGCLSESLERASARDIENLLNGRAAFVISDGNFLDRGAERRAISIQKREPRVNKRLSGMIGHLRQLESREEGSRLLGRAQLTKKELEELARLMDLPVSREDDAEKLRQKIIEESIGARLNSQAIRGF